MKYSIIQEDILNKKLIVSFDSALPNTEVSLPNDFFSSDGTRVIKSQMLDKYVSGFAPDKTYIKSYRLYMEQANKEPEFTELETVYVPSYLKQNAKLSEHMAILKAQGKLNTVEDNSTAPYVLKHDWDRDLQLHQTFEFSDTDSYIYFRNRLAFLQHVKSYVTYLYPSHKEESRQFKYIHFCVPKSLAELTQFLVSTKKYRITCSIDKPDFTTEYTANDVEKMFDESWYTQNQINHNVISLNPAKKVWVVEESFGVTYETVTGFVRRPKLHPDGNPAKTGVQVRLDKNTDDNINIIVFLMHCFYYYASPFELRYQIVDDKTLIPLFLDVAISLTYPKLHLIYNN